MAVSVRTGSFLAARVRALALDEASHLPDGGGPMPAPGGVVVGESGVVTVQPHPLNPQPLTLGDEILPTHPCVQKM